MSDDQKAFVYMLTNDRGTVLYIGSTSDLKERLYFHKRGMIPGFTKKYNVHRLVYFEPHVDMESAKKRERELKGKSRIKQDENRFGGFNLRVSIRLSLQSGPSYAGFGSANDGSQVVTETERRGNPSLYIGSADYDEILRFAQDKFCPFRFAKRDKI